MAAVIIGIVIVIIVNCW